MSCGHGSTAEIKKTKWKTANRKVQDRELRIVWRLQTFSSAWESGHLDISTYIKFGVGRGGGEHLSFVVSLPLSDTT